MSYERLNWKNGEIITADKLNHMDNGISESIENNINDIQLENDDTLVIIKNQNRTNIKINNVENSIKAEQDSDGNIINNTYLKKNVKTLSSGVENINTSMNQEGKYTGLYYFNDAVNTIGTLLTINNDANESANKIITQIKIILDGKKIAIRFYRGVSAWQPWYYLAPLDSPAITGKPTSPTAPIDTNNTQIATCEFVKAQSASMQIDTLDLNYQNNIYWSKEPSGMITQFIELTADTEEISISLPISFSQKCLFVGIEIDNEDKDISKNVSFNVIEKGLDSIKLFKIGEGTPNITVMVKGI